MPKILPLLLALPFLLVGCQEESLFQQSPSARNTAHLQALHQQLADAPYGWVLTYFPKVDSLLFTNASAHIREADFSPELYGYGGHNFLLSFSPDGWVEMQDDEQAPSTSPAPRSEWEVRQNSSTQLSFTTYNSLHRLVNERWNGSADLLLWRTDPEGRLWFRTTSYLDVAREQIVLRRLNSQAERDAFLPQAYQHRQRLEQMKRPVLTIRQGDKIFFRSDYPIQHIRGEVSRSNRYLLFLFNKTPNPIIERYPLEMNGLGSGYVGSDQGLTFAPGFRYNKNYIFRDFQAQGDKFVCELVIYYDPIERVEKWVSRHLYPQGQPTGIIAEIADETR